MSEYLITARPRRSALYIPGSNARALEKAKILNADILLLDLEDAAAPEKKDEARDMVAKAVAGGGYGKREVIIRINGFDTPWGMADLKAVSKAGPDAILVPKVDAPARVREIEKLMQESRAPDHTMIWAMMETPRGILNARDIAASSSRLTAFVMGTNDLIKELRAARRADRAPVMASLQQCLLAARAFDLACLDGVFNDIADADGFAAEARQGMEMGFDGKTLIHPGQIAPCNEIFAPSKEALALARKQIKAFAAAEKEGKAVAIVDGQLVENLHVEEAQRLMEMARLIKKLAGYQPVGFNTA